MIANEQQYQITKKWVKQFERALEAVNDREDMHPTQKQAYIDASTSQIEELKQAITTYEDETGYKDDHDIPVLTSACEYCGSTENEWVGQVHEDDGEYLGNEFACKGCRLSLYDFEWD